MLSRNIGHLTDTQQLHCYLQRSPKARLWVNVFGFDRTFIIAKKLLLPLGCVLSFSLAVVGGWNLVNLTLI
ncbi:hypothetical protein JYB87_13575 [Shewanella avicenniae]|uniref:Uncharacterized protein n=1 Tax=Shewanella avicenniae TaxID=2814294 RepID=A0ABX7QP33_9GAMM|nr:hypothetical protein [Shewanella avicenniae]QSX32767.1 hypothetical protein JYB87_13575 [Shewanella avicenniae]